MRKILQINTVINAGSTGRIAEGIGEAAIRNGWESYIAFGRNERPSQSTLIRIGNDWGVKLHVLQTRLFDNHAFVSKRATEKLVQQIEQIDPDIIHLHNLHGYYLHVGLLFGYLKQAGKPVIWTLHDCWPFTGHCCYFDFVNCDRWKSMCHDCPAKAIYPKSVLLDRSRQNFIHKKESFMGVRNLTIVTPSKWLANCVKASFLQAYPVKVIHNGIDLDVFQPTPSDFRLRYKLQDYFVLLGVAADWIQRKGYHCFLELSKKLKNDEKVVLVGVKKHQLKQLPSNVIGIQRTDSLQELAEIYSMADVLVNPTLEDNFPTVNLESLACGTPVVTFNSGGSSECIDSNCGLAVQRGDLDGLVNAVAAIREKGKKSYAAACRKRAEGLFDKKARFANYITLYDQNLDK